VPWKILASAGSFLNFMSAYAIFLGPIAGIMLFDFWVVKQRKYDVAALYQPDNEIYKYSPTNGFNWRALVAFLCGVAPSLPGLINSVNPRIDPGIGVYPYDIGWLIGFVGTSAIYVALSFLFPQRQSSIERAVLPDEVYDEHIIDGQEPSPSSASPVGDRALDEEEANKEKGNGMKVDEGVEVVEELSGFKKFASRMDRLL
jgi:NCS1 family nucleobase:cation symporter-1